MEQKTNPKKYGNDCTVVDSGNENNDANGYEPIDSLQSDKNKKR